MNTSYNGYERPEITVLYMELEGVLMAASGVGTESFDYELGEWDE